MPAREPRALSLWRCTPHTVVRYAARCATRYVTLCTLLLLSVAGAVEPDARAPANPQQSPRITGFARVRPPEFAQVLADIDPPPVTPEGASPPRVARPIAAGGSPPPSEASATPCLPPPDARAAHAPVTDAR